MKLNEMIEKMFGEAAETMKEMLEKGSELAIINRKESDNTLKVYRCYEKVLDLLSDPAIVTYRLISDKPTVNYLKNFWRQEFTSRDFTGFISLIEKCKFVIRKPGEENPIEIEFPNYEKGGTGIQMLNGSSTMKYQNQDYGLNLMVFNFKEGTEGYEALTKMMKEYRCAAMLYINGWSYDVETSRANREAQIEMECNPAGYVKHTRANVFPSSLSWGSCKYVLPNMIFNDDVMFGNAAPVMVCFDPLRRTINIKTDVVLSKGLTARQLYDQLTMVRDNFSHMREIPVMINGVEIADISAEPTTRYKNRIWNIKTA